jgi:hypothetical protein
VIGLGCATLAAVSASWGSAARSPWVIVGQPPQTVFRAIHALSDRDVWVAGERGKILEQRPVIEHWDGQRLRTLPPPSIGSATGGSANDVAPLSDRDVWVAGSLLSSGPSYEGRLLTHWDGTTWTTVAEPNLRGRIAVFDRLAAVGPNDLWVFGSSSTPGGKDNRFLAQHWDGRHWKVIDMPTDTQMIGGQDALTIHDTSVISSHDIWVVGDDSCGPGCGNEYVADWNGNKWQAVPYPSAPCTGDDSLNGVSAVAANSVWIVGYDQCTTLVEHWNGSKLQLTGHCGCFIYAVDLDASSPTNVWAVGHGIERWNGTRWATVSMSGLQQPDSLSRVAVTSPTTAWVIGTPTHPYSSAIVAHYTR